MSSFTDELVVKKLKNGMWETARDFEYQVGKEGSGNIVKVPSGFKTDFASVPRPFWIIIPPDGQYTSAAVVHDYLYNIQDRPRVTCDAIFLEAMQVLGVPLWKRRIMYRAVRMFGWIPWNFKNKEVRNERTRVLEDAKQQIPDD